MFRTVLFTLIATLASAPVFSASATADNVLQNSTVKFSRTSSTVKQTTHEVVFVDTQVADYETLISNLRDNIEVVVLDPEQDSVSQISFVLQKKNNLSAVHIITHGRDGEILFANGSLNATNLQNHALRLAGWSKALTEKADILFYGCNIAESIKGEAFARELSEITRADVATSKNVTGSKRLGGDWLLEHVVGEVEGSIVLTDAGAKQYQSILGNEPVFEKAVIGADGSDLRISYTRALDQASTPATSDYTVTALSSGPISVTGVTVNADQTVTLTLSAVISIGDTVTLDYVLLSGTPIQNAAGADAAALTAETVATGVVSYESTFWAIISPSGGSQFDYFVDQQTGQGEGDIVGDGGSNPGFQVHFDGNGNASNTDGTLSFRFRLAKAGSNFYMVGIDADVDGDIDVYVRLDTTNTNEISIYGAGAGLNVSPSTSSIGSELYAVPSTPSTLDSSLVTVIDGGVVTADLDGDTNTDNYVSGSVDFSELVTALTGLGITLTDTDPLRYAVATSVNGSTFNQDIAGLPKDYDADATYVSSGAFSDPVTLDGTITVVAGTPVINDLYGDTLAYVMNDPISIIDQSTGATITDVDDTTLDDAGALDGSLHVEIISGASVTEDELGLDTSLVSLSTGYAVGSIVTVGVTDIGTITDIGLGTDAINDPEISFTIAFDQIAGSATLANVDALIQAVTYVNSNTTTLTEGTRTVSFLVSDGAFNTQVSTSVSVTQVADITAPLAPTVDLLATSDSGDSSTDDITNVTTPVIQVTFDQSGAAATDTIAGDVVKLFEGITQVGSATLAATDIANGFVDITSSALTEGSLSFTATVTDISANVSSASTALPVSLLISTPTVAVTLTDSTLLKGETSLVTFTFSVEPSGFVEADDVTIQNGGFTGFGVTVNPKVYTATFTPSDNLNDITNVISVSTGYADVAGNTGSAASSSNYIINTLDLIAPVITVTAGTDTVEQGSTWTDAGATTTDNVDADGAASTTDTVDTSAVGDTIFTYTATDATGNVATPVTRTVTVTADATPPTIAVTAGTDTVEQGSSWTDAGATTTDNVDADGAASTTDTVDTSVLGDTIITYTATDAAGNVATPVTRTVTVTADATPPTIAVTAGTDTVEQGSSWTDAGATTTDNVDADGAASTTDTVDTSVVGDTIVTYTATDAAGNVATPVTRTVTVTADATAPVIAVTAGTDTVEQGSSWTDAGATTTDNVDAPGVASTTDTVDTSVLGDTIITYTATDAAGNVATPVTRTVTVTADATVPVISVTAGTDTVEQGSSWTDAGATTTDNVDADGAASTTDSVDTSVLGDTIITYTATDAAGNVATPVTRTVTVTADATAPVIAVTAGTDTVEQGSSWTDAGATTTDNVDAPGVASTTDTVDTSVVGDTIITYTATDAAGNVATPVTRTVAVTADVIPPVVTITNTTDANIANQNALPMNGTCTVGDGDVSIELTVTPSMPVQNLETCNVGGLWSTTFDVSGIAEGVNNLNIDASQTDAFGNKGTATSVQLSKDVSISVPTINLLTTSDTSPVISGAADTGTSNEIVIAGATYIVVATSGTWSVDTSSLPDSGTLNLLVGGNDVVVTSTDAVGNSAVDVTNNEVTLATDDDNDGIPNTVECPTFPVNCPDSDSDGTPDYMETDSDNDGIDDADEAGLDLSNPIDTDGDGTPDYQDTDSDNDGVDDILEGIVDSDADGIPDYVDIGGTDDSDGDGIPDNVECAAYPACLDRDNDGQPDYFDTDSDNDGLDDALEAGIDPTMPIDTDGDGEPDYLDTDSDEDGTDDSIEGLTDADGDGIPDYVDVVTTSPGAGDSDGDGIADNIECVLYPLCADSDADGTPDYMETDSDNDGIPDAVETGTTSIDTDVDGIDDALDVDATGGLDLDGNGVDDTQPLDTDSDGVPDYQDTDSDADGIDDVTEGVVDTDADGIPDYLDVDSTNVAGTADGSGDSDGDGISDLSECPAFPACPDIDGDGSPDYMDANPNDGPLADFDGDGRLNYLDPDDDNDNIPDVVEDPNMDGDNNPFTNPLDSDLDGIPDYLDLDSDNDGLSDDTESGASGNDSDGDNIDDIYDVDLTGGADANSDGIDDAVKPLDSDGDSLPDYLDVVFDGDRDSVDTDGDGTSDAAECPVFPTDCPDSDGDGTPDFLETDSDGDGLDDTDEKGSLDSGVLLDTDGDGKPDYRDLDSDGDGIPDAIEGLTTDSDSDGIPDALDVDSSGAPFGGDSDGDGVVDLDECSTYPNCADSNNDGTPDYMDSSTTPYDVNADVSTGLNGVGSNGPWSILLILSAFMLRRKTVSQYYKQN